MMHPICRSLDAELPKLLQLKEELLVGNVVVDGDQKRNFAVVLERVNEARVHFEVRNTVIFII